MVLPITMLVTTITTLYDRTMFSKQKNNWTQSDLRFCENEGKKDWKSMKKDVNWIEN